MKNTVLPLSETRPFEELPVPEWHGLAGTQTTHRQLLQYPSGTHRNLTWPSGVCWRDIEELWNQGKSQTYARIDHTNKYNKFNFVVFLYLHMKVFQFIFIRCCVHCCGLWMSHVSFSFLQLSLSNRIVSSQSSLLYRQPMFVLVSLFLVCLPVFLPSTVVSRVS